MGGVRRRSACEEDTGGLRAAGYGKIRFAVDITEKPLGADGIDQVRFLMSATWARSCALIHKIASGGELAVLCWP